MRHVVLVVGLACAAAGVLQAQSKPAEKPQADQPVVAAAPDVPTAETNLGSVRIPRSVKADGKPLERGTYQVRLTAEQAKPDVVGQTPQYERWVEFLRGGQVRGREVVSIVPPAEIAKVAEDSPPRAGGSKVQMLKGNDYIRVWINRGGVHYLVHLVPA